MKDYLISMFIDNELNLDEKIDFVETVHDKQAFKDETLELLKQEKVLHAELVHQVPEIRMPLLQESKKGFFIPWLRPAALFSAGLALGAAILFVMPTSVPIPIPATVASKDIPHRFIIYRPNADHADIIGTFTRWQPMAMEKIGPSGYWSLTLNLPEGEYQYSYLVEDGQQIADPTIQERVQDDFGGENSVLSVKA
ncbi:MAG: glycogen-binding domain-containing protein [Proteobacteria bacterium]|nr:glycogen-binding domain-containing protein [Pseudomonadota bacterium]MBU1137743.1 glycogen-binding domain-containing protein [Pseudomonadota bacterium]MBU1416901.1 glycogen-binding domain-containing protein [Pseudomonadota bacterium]MBU1454056.1 glycogen-binding domain-containing protein [Pseudomonadota bacterium]